MADVKWIKITTDIFDDEKVLLIETLPEADSIIVIWFKLLCLAGKINNHGVFMLNDKVAYTDKMLATIFRRKESTVKMALETFEQFGMIEIVDNVITIPNWGKHQSLDQLENKRDYQREYMRKYRQEQKEIACKTNSKTNNKTNSKSNVSEQEYISNSNNISNSNSNSYLDIINKNITEHNYSTYISNILRDWFLYKREKGNSYKTIGLSRLLNKVDKMLLTYSEEQVGKVIEECMERNYQGIIWDLLEKKVNSSGSAYIDAIKNRVAQVDDWV